MQTEASKSEQGFDNPEGIFGPFEEPASASVADECTKTCSEHGDFTSHRVGAAWTWCPGCEEERDERVRQREQEEQQRRKTEKIERLLKDACIPVRFAGKTLDSFIAETGAQRRVLEAARKYVEEFSKNLESGRSMLWCGPVGTGKTHLACGILDALARAGHRVHYVTAAKAVRWLRSTWRKGSDVTEQEAIDWFAELALLVVDEVGMQYGTDAEKLQLFELINARYNGVRPTLVLFNLDREGLQAYLGDCKHTSVTG
jgi:DNA replication protein DnaC